MSAQQFRGIARDSAYASQSPAANNAATPTAPSKPYAIRCCRCLRYAQGGTRTTSLSIGIGMVDQSSSKWQVLPRIRVRESS